jgi:hypothetical protein
VKRRSGLGSAGSMANDLQGKRIAFLAAEGVEQLVEELAEGRHAGQASSVA